MSDNPDTPIQCNPTVITQRAENEVVLILPQQGQVKVLNATGAFIWQALQEGQTPSEIIAMLCSRFAVDTAQAQKDFWAFIQTLRTRKLVE